MPQIRFDELAAQPLGAEFSDARGPVYRTETVEVARVHFGTGTGARPHRHPEEQAVVVLAGRISVRIGEERFVAGPGDAWHVPSGVEHEVHCIEEMTGVSFKRLA